MTTEKPTPEVKRFLNQDYVSLDDYRIMEAMFLEKDGWWRNLKESLPTMNAPASVPWATFELRYGGYTYVKRSHAKRGIERAIAALRSEIQPKDPERRYTPEELVEVATRTLIPKDMYKRAALMGLIAAFGDPDKIFAASLPRCWRCGEDIDKDRPCCPASEVGGPCMAAATRLEHGLADSRSSMESSSPNTRAELVRRLMAYVDSFGSLTEGITLVPEMWNNLRADIREATDMLERTFERPMPRDDEPAELTIARERDKWV